MNKRNWITGIALLCVVSLLANLASPEALAQKKEPTATKIGPPLLHGNWVRSIAFSPDGKIVATGSADGVRLWDAATGKPIGKPLKHKEEVFGVAFGPDSKTLAAVSALNDAEKTGRGELRFWDIAKGKIIGDPIPHPADVYSVAYSRDGKMVLTGSRDGVSRVWDPSTRQAISTLTQANGTVWSVGLAEDGKGNLAVTFADTVRLWRPATGKPIGKKLNIPNPGGAVFSPDGKVLATSCGIGDKGKKNVGHVLLWEMPSAKLLRTLDLPIPPAAVFSPDSKTLLTGGNKELRLWDVATGNAIGTPWRHTGGIIAVAFSSDGTTVAAGGADDNSAQLWKITLPK